MDNFKFDENGLPFIVADDISYEIITNERVILDNVHDYAAKLISNPWRAYMNVDQKSMEEWLLLYAKKFAIAKLSVAAKCLKTNKYIGYNLGLDCFEDTNEIDKQLPAIFAKESEFFSVSKIRVKKYLENVMGIKGIGVIVHFSKGVVLDGYENKRVFQRMSVIQFINAIKLGYKYTLGEPTNPKSQHINFQKGYDDFITTIDEAYFEDYSVNGKTFKAPITDVFKKPTIATTVLNLEKFIKAVSNVDFKTKF